MTWRSSRKLILRDNKNELKPRASYPFSPLGYNSTSNFVLFVESIRGYSTNASLRLSKNIFGRRIPILNRSWFGDVSCFKRKETTGSEFDSLINLIDKSQLNKESTKKKYSSKTSDENSIRIVGNGYLGSPKSFILNHSSGRRFLFNCAEDTSRILMEMNQFEQLKHLDVLFTRSTWNRCFSGVFGLIYKMITQNKQRSPSIRFHAPFDTTKFLYDTYHLLNMSSIRVKQFNKDTFVDSKSNIKIDRLKFSSQVFGYLVTIGSSCRILVVDLPTSNLLEKLRLDSVKIDLIVHLSSNKILQDKKCIKFVNRISGKHTKHLVFDESSTNIVSEQIYLNQSFLNNLDRHIFPLLPIQKSKSSFRANICLDDNYIDAKTNSLIDLNNMKLVSDEKTAKKWGQLIDICESTSDEMNSQVYPEVVFLGTSSTSPTLTRNVSSILVKIAAYSSILMDCGEGSLGQFMRFHGNSNYHNEIIKIKAVFISHLHADHHLGIFELMSTRRKAFELLGIPYEKLFILLPNNLRLFFDSINKFSDDVSFFDMVEIINNELLMETESKKTLAEKLRLRDIETVPVRHVPYSTGLILTASSIDYKLVYSGDCSPSRELIKRGKDCDLLIHEATFDDSKTAMAENLMHSTMSQAIEVGQSMNAKNVVLTHFSSVLSNDFSQLYKKTFDNVFIAHDFMRINQSLINKLKLLKSNLNDYKRH